VSIVLMLVEPKTQRWCSFRAVMSGLLLWGEGIPKMPRPEKWLRRGRPRVQFGMLSSCA